VADTEGDEGMHPSAAHIGSVGIAKKITGGVDHRRPKSRVDSRL